MGYFLIIGLKQFGFWISARQEQPFYGPLIALGSTTHYKKTTWVSTTLVSCCVECELVHFLTAGFWALKSGQMLMSEHEKSLWCCLEPSSQIFLFVSRHAQFKICLILSLIALFACFGGRPHRKKNECLTLFGFNFSPRYLSIKIRPDFD